MSEPQLPFDVEHPPAFDGETFSPQVDGFRLTKQALRVFELMRDGVWRTLAQIAAACECPEGSANARLRDFRKDKFGAHTVERQRDHETSGLYFYRLVPNPQRRLVLEEPEGDAE